MYIYSINTNSAVIIEMIKRLIIRNDLVSPTQLTFGFSIIYKKDKIELSMLNLDK